MQDIIEQAEGPELIAAVWDTLEKITILDPACGSGAFLFAALNILDPLYDACLERMRFFLSEWGEEGATNHPKYYDLFTQTLQKVDNHASHRYFILKSIIVNNLYGVDIMEEAVEICRLRLFLKLIAQIERVSDIEPLPDIDFNIRAGNSLVGFASLNDVRSTLGTQLDFGDGELMRIEEKALAADKAFRTFREMQTDQGVSPRAYADIKALLRKQLKSLADDLDRLLASEYGINPHRIRDKAAFEDAFKAWKKSHMPFHWFGEFYGIIKSGGFDVVIGNPPYVELEKVRALYTVLGYVTEECGNLYALVTERSLMILRQGGRLSFIIPVASTCTDGYRSLQNLMMRSGELIFSSYNDRPGRLFEGLEHIRQSIIFCHRTEAKTPTVYSSKYNRWNTVERPLLFPRQYYVEASAGIREGSIPKLSSPLEYGILRKLNSEGSTVEHAVRKGSDYLIYYTRKLSGFVQILDFIPAMFDSKGKRRKPSELKELAFSSALSRDVFLSLLNSSLFFWYLTIYSDCRNLNKREINWMPLSIVRLAGSNARRLSELSRRLMEDFKENSRMLEMKYEKMGKLKVQAIYPKYSKTLIDEIDSVLAAHFGFSEEELDFIINYDIKYRMGGEVESAEIS